MKTKRRILEAAEDSNVGIKRFLCSVEDRSHPDDETPKKSSCSSEADGLVIKSFYGSSAKCSYLNPLERKTSRENRELISCQSVCQLPETQKSPKDEAVFDKSTRQLFSSQNKLEVKHIQKSTGSAVRKPEAVKNKKPRSTKPLINPKSLDSSKTGTGSHDGLSDNSGCASTNSTPNKFFRNRSPRKHALLSGRGPAMLINRDFSVKFQLTPGPKLQKPQQRVLPKMSSVTPTNHLDVLAIDENQNHSSKDQTVAKDEEHTCSFNIQQKLNDDEMGQQGIADDEVDTAADRASSSIHDAATEEANSEKGHSSDVAEILFESHPCKALDTSESDLFASSESSEMIASQSLSKGNSWKLLILFLQQEYPPLVQHRS